jgi:NADH-quinone oxidoreductase subunit A
VKGAAHPFFLGGALESIQSLWPWLVYSILALLTVAGMLGCSYVLGQRHSGPDRDTPYESGMNPTGSARLRFRVNFYVVALLFIVFDVASVFIVTWAISVRALGWAGLVEMAIFIGVIGVALLYFWRIGALGSVQQ